MTRTRLVLWALLPVAGLAGGCLGTPKPAIDGIPVRRLPDEVLGRPKAELHPIPLTLLRRTTDLGAYRLDRGDVLGVYIEDPLGNKGQPIPVRFNPDPNALRPAAQGHPVPVRDDGTILLPELPPISVKGKTLAEAQQLIVGMVVGDIFLPGSKRLLVAGTEQVVVDLIQPRRYRVLVVREDCGPAVGGPACPPCEGTKKGTGHTIYLEAYKNDLLEALNRTGGPPGPDAKNEVVIRRGSCDPLDPAKGYIRIPLRVGPHEPITFSESDIILNDGDTVYIENRDDEVYYTAGLIGAGQGRLPRDHDLRVIEAICQVHGPLADGCCHQSAIVVRRLSNNREIRIWVDLDEAFRDQRENILIQPGDIIVLQERPGHALMGCCDRTFRLPSFGWRCHFPHCPSAGPCNDP
ncbi:MAG TPA: polysaccharide biosynthesis/export family protein [Gemmataceae bacterium]|nr:polysaccharide biosynthesis/export family protein [Gemmataceae bacterium]